MIGRLLCILTIAFAPVLQPTASAVDSVPQFLSNKSLVVARIGESNQFTAYSKRTGEWTDYTFPKGVTVTPVTGAHLIAFALEGDSIANLVAVDAKGKWQIHKIADANAKICTPHIGDNLAIYKIGETAYGFSGVSGVWDSIATKEMPQISDASAMIVESGKISMFSSLSGKWSTSRDLSP